MTARLPNVNLVHCHRNTGPVTQTASYNNLNQLTNLPGQSLTFDANGNLLTDGQRSYSWDAENRLVGITYPGQAGKQTAFAYDGLSRRIAIGSTPAGGGSATTTSYLWCGSSICQARNAGNAAIRAYYAEGEIVPGTTPQTYYYGQDQIGSTRRVFASTTSAPAYGYDPYGRALQATAPLTDFNYAGMFYNADSGLYLTWYRAYDPVAGRWLSRDPLGELSDTVANLYPYVGGNPLSATDPTGEVYSPSNFKFWTIIARICGLLLGPPTAPVDPPPDPPKVQSPANPAGAKGAPPPPPPEGPGGLRPPPPPPEPPIFRPPPIVR